MKIKVYIGVIGSGKDYTAKKECDKQIAFADQLREDVWTMIGWRPKTDEEYEDFKATGFLPTSGSLYSDSPIGWFTGRDLLQRYGTDVRRREYENHWVDTVIDKIWQGIDTGTRAVGITDCRFPNEVSGLIRGIYDLNKMQAAIEGAPFKLEFVHCNYMSDRYDATNPHESEKLAQQYVTFKGTQKEFNELIFNTYG